MSHPCILHAAIHLMSQKPDSPLLQIVFVIDGKRVHGCAKRDLLMVRHYGRKFIRSPASTCAASIRSVRDEDASEDESRKEMYGIRGSSTLS